MSFFMLREKMTIKIMNIIDYKINIKQLQSITQNIKQRQSKTNQVQKTYIKLLSLWNVFPLKVIFLKIHTAKQFGIIFLSQFLVTQLFASTIFCCWTLIDKVEFIFSTVVGEGSHIFTFSYQSKIYSDKY